MQIGTQPQDSRNPGGYVINDGSTYAPQMPWYMSHYCQSNWPNFDRKDPVCYADYLSTFNAGFSGTLTAWPKQMAWSVLSANADNLCKPGLAPNNTACIFAMAGFDLADPVSPDSPVGTTDPRKFQYKTFNGYLFTWFNNALKSFPKNLSAADLKSHCPWDNPFNERPPSGRTQFTRETDIYPHSFRNPFLGQYTYRQTVANNPNCMYIPANAPTQLDPAQCYPSEDRADHFLYPRQCSLAGLVGTDTNVARLRQCGLTYELHHNGWLNQWPDASWLTTAMFANQYGRTSFLFAGVPGMQLPVSFYKDPKRCPELCPSTGPNAGGLSVYEQVHNASLFSLYLPIANEADLMNANMGRNYGRQFYHTLLMSNHMEMAPQDFADGIRGKVLWHDEYRTEQMQLAFTHNNDHYPTKNFPAAFLPANAKAPYHNYTCDGCHVRNGSGIPINTATASNPENDPAFQYMLDAALGKYMISSTDKQPYNPYKSTQVCNNPNYPTEPNPTMYCRDYTFTGVIKPMKLVFFDLNRRQNPIDPEVYTKPLGPGLYYANAIMNFYGESFHVTNPTDYNYSWYFDSDKVMMANRLVVKIDRKNPEGSTYLPMQVSLFDPAQLPNKFVGTFTGSFPCKLADAPKVTNPPPWPASCSDINNKAITAAISDAKPQVGFMLLNGKRLGNLGAIEAIPNTSIIGFQQNEVENALGGGPGCLTSTMPSPACALAKTIAGQILWSSGTRGGVYCTGRSCGAYQPRVGVVASDQKLTCNPASPVALDCYIGRFGWLGDRVSLEDQVANAAFIEMNMTTSGGYNALYSPPFVGTPRFPIRYNFPNCGNADASCVGPGGNGDLSETDINRMADYARWLGSPTRSEFEVSLPEVIQGEKVFRELQCNACHVIDKIQIGDPSQTMLDPVFRKRLATHVNAAHQPFLSYLGTDLLMHDMGYLSQVAFYNPTALELGIRNVNAGYVVVTGCSSDLSPCRCPSNLPECQNYDKTKDFRDYVQKIRTPALKGLRFNRFVTEANLNTKPGTPPNPACDFLLHDGRACDAIEAAFLHDGPEILKLNMIGKLSARNPYDIQALRAFLYSL